MASEAVEKILAALDRVRPAGKGMWRARCPSHDGKNPEGLSVTERGERILIRCWAGCAAHEVLDAIGLSMSDLWTVPLQKHHVPAQKQRAAISLRAAAKALREESAILVLAAEDVAAGRTIGPQDRLRVAQAVDRVTRADEILRRADLVP